DESRLPRTVGADEADDLSPGNGDIDVADRYHTAVAFGQAGSDEETAHCACLPLSLDLPQSTAEPTKPRIPRGARMSTSSTAIARTSVPLFEKIPEFTVSCTTSTAPRTAPHGVL